MRSSYIAAALCILSVGTAHAQTPLTALPAESVVAATALPLGVNINAALVGYEDATPTRFASYEGPALVTPFISDESATHLGPLTVSTPMPQSEPDAMTVNGAEASGAFGEYTDAPFAWGIGQVVRF